MKAYQADIAKFETTYSQIFVSAWTAFPPQGIRQTERNNLPAPAAISNARRQDYGISTKRVAMAIAPRL